jgi:hypothetical protein
MMHTYQPETTLAGQDRCIPTVFLTIRALSDKWSVLMPCTRHRPGPKQPVIQVHWPHHEFGALILGLVTVHETDLSEDPGIVNPTAE